MSETLAQMRARLSGKDKEKKPKEPDPVVVKEEHQFAGRLSRNIEIKKENIILQPVEMKVLPETEPVKEKLKKKIVREKVVLPERSLPDMELNDISKAVEWLDGEPDTLSATMAKSVVSLIQSINIDTALEEDLLPEGSIIYYRWASAKPRKEHSDNARNRPFAVFITERTKAIAIKKVIKKYIGSKKNE